MRREAEYSKGLGSPNAGSRSDPDRNRVMAMPCGRFETDLRSREGGQLHEWEYRDERARHGDAVACNQ
ncbi:hypothetical protein ABIE33_006326 [Ensifer sp. 4252]